MLILLYCINLINKLIKLIIWEAQCFTHIISFNTKPNEVTIAIDPILWIRKLRPREEYAQRYRDSKRRVRGSQVYLMVPRLYASTLPLLPFFEHSFIPL